MTEKIKSIFVVIGSISSVLLPLFFHLSSLEDKCLSYEIINGQLLSDDNVVNIDDLEILFKKEKIDNIYFSFIKIENSGDVPIRKDDFDNDVSIEFNKDNKRLKAEKWGSNPKGLQIDSEIKDNKIYIKPLLLNKGEYVAIQVLTNGKYEEPILNVRIVGLDSFEKVGSNESLREVKSLSYLALGFLSAAIYVYLALNTVFAYTNGFYYILLPRFFSIIAIASTLFGGISLTKRYLLYKDIGFFSWPFIVSMIMMFISGYLAYRNRRNYF